MERGRFTPSALCRLVRQRYCLWQLHRRADRLKRTLMAKHHKEKELTRWQTWLRS